MISICTDAPFSPSLSVSLIALSNALSAWKVYKDISAIFIKISCSVLKLIINFCTAAPAVIKIAFFNCFTIFNSAAKRPSSSAPKSGMLTNSLLTAVAGPIRSSLPFMARFSIISTVSKRLISFVPS